MICRECGEPFEHDIHDDDPVHQCPTHEHLTILLLVSQPTKVSASSEEPSQFEMSVDQSTGRTVVIGRARQIYKATCAIKVGDEDNMDSYTFEAREALSRAIENALTNGKSRGKI